jgi:hypothetical protein
VSGMRVTLGGLQWVYEDGITGTCQHCDKPIKREQGVYRMPRKPWKSRKDPLVHVLCWDEHKARMEPTMDALRRMREGTFQPPTGQGDNAK